VKVFIDGREGTTGLQIQQRLERRDDVSLIVLPEDLRKDPEARRAALNEADIVFLCLPDEAARESVSMIANDHTRVIDASTAHRIDPDWVYGFPELRRGQRDAIAAASRVTNPGCHATGFLAIAAPLLDVRVIPEDMTLHCFSLSGYSGAGKRAIAQYEAVEKSDDLYSPRLYGMNQRHKHIPEMMAHSGVRARPVFSPVIDDYFCGMATTVTFSNRALKGHPYAEDLRDILATHYLGSRFVRVAPFDASVSFLPANTYAGTNDLEISVFGDQDLTQITARFDNLGKGASGAAVQNMNIMLGLPEDWELR